MGVILWSQNTTHLALPFSLQTGSGSPIDLTNVASSLITFKVRPALPRSAYTALSGSVTVTIPSLGQGFFQFAPNDVNTPGTFYLVISVAFTATSLWNSFEQPFTITQST